MKKIIRYAAGILLFFFFLLLISLFVTAVRSAMSAETQNVFILAEYPEKIVYKADSYADTALFEEDCHARGGKFNTCGSPCPPRAQMCLSVCAFTCELEKIII